ncbi:MAG TPA: hypothetical protein VFT64_12030 [Rickettsiales bacterium]|nr:hypothetical protein [Rickettsiales bacterium]
MSASLLCQPALATDQLDISTGLKTWLLVNERPTGVIKVAVLFDESNPLSKADAQTIKDDMDKGIGIPGGVEVTAGLVASNDATQLAGARVAFLTDGMSETAIRTAGKTALKAGVLTISTNLNCVAMEQCIIGIISKPRVEIYYSATAAEAAHISFSPAFIMLVRQL